MKIKHLPIALAALILASCGGSNNGGESTTATNPNDSLAGESTTATNPNDSLAEYVAYQVYKLICPDSTAPLHNPIESNLEYQVFSMPNDETERSETVLCFPKKDGGYLAVYNVEECSVVGDGGCYNLAFKTYDYSDGRVKEDNSLLPKPSFDDFNKYEALWFYNPKDKNLVSAKDAFAKDDFKYDIWRDNTISVSVVSVGEGDLFLYMFYKFNGERFEQVESNEWLGIISTKGLGKLCVGDVPPSQLAGFDINTMGRTMYFNRNAKKEFKLALSADGKIDTIIVVGKSYDYRYWCGGGYCYLGVGSDFDSVVAEMLNDYVYEDDHSCIKTDGYVVEFCCKPEYHKIESIKIYKQAEANTSDYDENNSNSDLPPTATGDLNGDGIKDSVAFNKGFFVYFGGADGKYNLFKTYKVFPYETDEINSYDYSTDIENGKLIITTRRSGDGGFQDYYYTLKFQNDDFVLLKLIDDGGLDGSSTQIYDFEAKTYKGDFHEYEGDSYTTTAKLKNLPSPKLSDIVIGDSPYDCIDGYIDESTEKTKTR
ncbi:MAG: hypothetical protein J6Z01_00100 [Bacteroidales bacterium]|nr:hypothetical protein [Bacteroidales bacterium]